MTKISSIGKGKR